MPVIGRLPGESLIIMDGSRPIASVTLESVDGGMARVSIETGHGVSCRRSESAGMQDVAVTSGAVTTGQAAKALGVSHRTIKQWVDLGRLKGHRLPSGGARGYGFRRVLLSDLKEFAEANGIPLGEIVPHKPRVARK